MAVDWDALGIVLVTALGVSVLVVVLFSLGIAAWSRTAPGPGACRPRAATAAALLCFGACLAVAGCAIDVIVPS